MPTLFRRFIPILFVLLIITLLFPALRTTKVDWKQIAHASVAGVLLLAIYLGGVFAGVNEGIGAGLSSLIVGIQPVLTVLLAAHVHLTTCCLSSLRRP